MKKKVLLIIIYCSCNINLFSQIPNGAQETFHLKIAQENRLFITKCQATYFSKGSRWSNILMTNGAMVELGLKKITLSSTFLTDYFNSGGTNKIDFDLGYDYSISKTIKVQPFIGCELNANGTGLTVGAKLNKSFDVLEYASLGVFIGCRYSRSKDLLYIDSYSYTTSDYISASIGAYCSIYNYKRPTINKNW